MRLSSGNSLSQMGNGSAHMGPGSLDDLDARVGSSRQDFPPRHTVGQATPQDGAGPLMNGGLHEASNGSGHEGSEQPLAMKQSLNKRLPSTDWNQHARGRQRDTQHEEVRSNLLFMTSQTCHQKVQILSLNLQVPAQARLSTEVLRQHTQMNNHHSGNAAIIDQIQALTATHQQLADQIQALIKVVGDQHMAAKRDDNASSFVIAASVALCVVLGIVIAKFLI